MIFLYMQMQVILVFIESIEFSDKICESNGSLINHLWYYSQLSITSEKSSYISSHKIRNNKRYDSYKSKPLTESIINQWMKMLSLNFLLFVWFSVDSEQKWISLDASDIRIGVKFLIMLMCHKIYIMSLIET